MRQLRVSFRVSFLVLALSAVFALSAAAQAGALELLPVTQDRNDNQLQIRKLRVDNVTQVTVDGASRQSLTCWQVVHGSWNGQNLDGLSLVMVRQAGDVNGTATNDKCIFVSDTATPAQREALVAAVAASNPGWFNGLKDIRIEPAAIDLEEVDGRIVVIHIGRIA